MRSADLSLSVFLRTSISAWKTSILQRFLWKPSWTTMLYKRSRWSYTCRYSNDLWKHPARLCFFCKNQSEVCFLQDTFNGSASNKPFFTSVATITVRVKDVDNRPPWFQPCTRTNLGNAKLCVSSGYRGKVNLTEKQVGSDWRLHHSKKRNALHLNRKSLTWLTSLGLILIMQEPSCYSSSYRKKVKNLIIQGKFIFDMMSWKHIYHLKNWFSV